MIGAELPKAGKVELRCFQPRSVSQPSHAIGAKAPGWAFSSALYMSEPDRDWFGCSACKREDN